MVHISQMIVLYCIVLVGLSVCVFVRVIPLVVVVVVVVVVERVLFVCSCSRKSSHPRHPVYFYPS